MDTHTVGAHPLPQKTPKKAALASWIGSVLEYYDFYIYGLAAALVFNKVFFPSSSPATGTLLALATFGVGYVARPLGAFVLGHVGDRYGRKNVLVGTLLLMGTATFLVGCIPSYESIGVWAPIILVALRLMQGFSASGEQAGANSMTLEHSPDDRRAFYTSFTLGGTQTGLIIATAIFIPLATLPDEQLLAWGWRVPFWASIVVVGIGLYIRRNIEEAPAFKLEASEENISSAPLVTLFREHKANLLRVILSSLASTISTMFGVYALSYAVNTTNIERSTMLWVSVAAAAVSLVFIPIFAILSDRIGRKPLFVFGTLGSGALMFVYLAAIAGGNLIFVFAVGILMSGIVYHAQNGIWPAFYGEMFPTKVRLSGMAIGTQIGFAIGGFGPSIGAAIVGDGAHGWIPVATYTFAICAIAAVAALTARETYNIPLSEIDGRSTNQDDHGDKAHARTAIGTP